MIGSKKFTEIQKLKDIITKKQFKFSFLLLLLVFIGTFFEMLGIGALFPLLTFLSDGDTKFVENINFFFNLKLDISNKEYLIFIFSIFILLIYFFKSLYLTFLSYVFATYTKKIKISLTINLFNKYLSLKFLSMIKKNSNIAINTITKEVDELSANFVVPLIILINEIIVATGILFFIIYLFPSTSIFLIVVLGLAGSIFLIFSKKYNTVWGSERLKYSELSLKNINQSLNAFKEIKLLGNKDIFINSLNKYVDIKVSSETKQSILDQIPRFWLEFLCLTSILLYAFFFISSKNEFSELIPLIGIFALAGFRILPSLNRIITTLQIIRFGKASINKIYDELTFLDQNQEIATTNSFNESFLTLNISNLSFSYPDQSEIILDNVNLDINKNECIGIIGESGSGKTTLVNLISGLMSVKNGSININNTNLNLLRTNWQKKIGYVPQNIYIFDDTIRNNIAFEIDDDLISDIKIEKAIEFSKLKKFIDKLPNKIDTNIGEKGNKLSGWQIQRIGIARALYRDPELLILDEPTSSLDSKTEEEFIETLNKVKNEYTTIIISHSPNAIKYCDKVYRLLNGKIDQINLKK